MSNPENVDNPATPDVDIDISRDPAVSTREVGPPTGGPSPADPEDAPPAPPAEGGNDDADDDLSDVEDGEDSDDDLDDEDGTEESDPAE